MGWNLHGLGDLIARSSPAGRDFVNVVSNVGDPIVKLVSPVANLGSSMLQSIMGLSNTMMSAAGNMAKGVSNWVSSPSFVWILGGGLVLVAIVVLKSGGPSGSASAATQFLKR